MTRNSPPTSTTEIARITELINSELSQADEVMRHGGTCVDAGGTRLDRFFTVARHQRLRPRRIEVTVAGAAIELMHLGTLCHDRVVDESEREPQDT